MAETPYNPNTFDPDDQISAEEAIASHLMDELGHSADLSEDIAAQLGRDILLLVLKRFRGDLFEGKLRCEYHDCQEQHPLAVQDTIAAERVTCEKCRAYMGLPSVEDDRRNNEPPKP